MLALELEAGAVHAVGVAGRDDHLGSLVVGANRAVSRPMPELPPITRSTCPASCASPSRSRRFRCTRCCGDGGTPASQDRAWPPSPGDLGG